MKRLIVLSCLLSCLTASAQTSPDKISDLEKKLDALSHEVEQLKLGGATGGYGEQENALLKRLTLGGYADINVQLPSKRNQKGDVTGMRKTGDLQQFVLEGEYRWTDRISMKLEMEFEHAGTGEGSETRGEVGMEQAYFDFRHSDPLTARFGHFIVPLGLINISHEPPTFHGVRRPNVERFIIPSTWHENGLGITGKYGRVEYQTYVFAGLKAVPAGGAPTVDGFTGASGIRGGRTEGSRSPIEDLAWASRVDVRPIPGVLAGAGLYVGQADHNLTAASIPVSLWEAHGAFDYKGAELRVLYAEGRVGNADALNAAQLGQNAGFTDFVGRRQFGGYVSTAFNVLSLKPETKQYLAPFYRYERYDTQSRVPDMYTNNAANSRVEHTLGLTYKPVPNVSIKGDFQWMRNQARTGVDLWNFGVGVMF